MAGRAAVVRGYKEKQRYVFPGDRRARYDRGEEGGRAGGRASGARLYIRRVEGRKGAERGGGGKEERQKIDFAKSRHRS